MTRNNLHPMERLVIVTAETLRDQYPEGKTRAQLTELLGEVAHDLRLAETDAPTEQKPDEKKPDAPGTNGAEEKPGDAEQVPTPPATQ